MGSSTPEGSSEVEGRTPPPEIWLEPGASFREARILAADPRLLSFFLVRESACPRTLGELIAESHPSRRSIEAVLDHVGWLEEPDLAEIRWLALPVRTPSGSGLRLIAAQGWEDAEGELGVSPAGPRRAVHVWAHGLPHQLRNQQMVLTNSIFSLTDTTGTPLEPAARRACLELARGGVERSLAMLEGFTHLADPEAQAAPVTVGEVVRWFEVLAAPRVRSREATLEIEVSATSEVGVELPAASERLAAVLECCLAALVPGSTLRIRFRATHSTIESGVTLVGTAQGTLEQVCAALARWGVVGSMEEDGVLTIALPRATGGGA